jgi:Carboxypeptidase regulatory-like domain/TonB dependent receptor
MRILRKSLPVLIVLCFLGAAAVWAGVTGSISGIVTDQSGSVIPDASVTATNVDTSVKSTIKTDSKGFYNFPNLPVGNYDIEVAQPGFKTFRKTAIRIDANSEVRVDVKLDIGEIAEKVTVHSDVVQVETQSTQMGEVIGTEKILATPLNGRDFTNLLSLQPGVVPFAYADALNDSNLNDRTVGGSSTTNAGTQSINGQRETSNGFMVNGANVQEGKNNGTAIIPNLDSIEEFRIITNNFDAEYGNYSGGQVNVITKSGTNSYHGSVFEFLRNTDLDARNYFTGPIGKLIQNQFGGTVGGPIKKDKLFFFADYQGTRQIFGPTQTAEVPDGTLDANGNYDLSSAQQTVLATAAETAANPANMTSVGTVQEDLLAARLNTTVGTPYFTGPTMMDPSRPVCTMASQCVFPNGVVPKADFSPAAAGLLPFIPSPNVLNNSSFNYSTSAFDRRQRDDKIGGRLDYNTLSYGTISAYWHGDDTTVHDPFPSSGATVASPNIGAYTALSRTRAQVIVLSDTKSFGSTAVNEFRFSYLRNAAHLFTPVGGLSENGAPITLASLGFTAPAGSGPTFNGGIGPIVPQFEGVPAIDFTGTLNLTNLGVPADSPNQFNNTFQLQDNFSKIFGRHSLKFGADFHYDQINYRNLFGENGNFTFSGSETGGDFADFLIGAPSTFIQATRQLLDSRTKYVGLYAQDSWRVTSNLTFNYGLRYEIIQPWYDTEGKIETLVPGVQSVLFPGAPTGWVVPGDPGIPSTLAPTQYNNFGPRLGLAYSPPWDSGFLAKLTGGPGKTSIRVGYGLFYTALEDLTQFQEVGDVPYGLFFVTSGTFFDTPFAPTDSSGLPIVQRFPFTFPPKNVSAKNPDANFCWSAGEMLPNGTTCAGGVLPIAGDLAYKHGNVTPYAEDYELSIQRQIGSTTLLSFSYVGNQAHKLLTSIESNPASAALCLQLDEAPYNPPGNPPPCGPFGEAGVYTLPPGVGFPPVAAANPKVQLTNQPCLPPSTATTCNAVNGTFTVFPPQNGVQVFNNNPYEATIAQSAYNSFQASVRHNSSYATFLVGYTFSKCRDDASELIEGINPFNPKASTSLCAFDVTNNFVASYEAKLPFDRAFHANRLTSGWAISGLSTFATGVPVSLSETDDQSLTGTANTSAPIDLPDLAPGNIHGNRNPRSGQPYFNVNLFSQEMLGTIGNSPRRFFHGPGLNNWDMALIKDTKITESKSLEFRFEAFNTFNHAQFMNPNGSFNSGFPDIVNGVNTGGTFGLVSMARDPRIMQAALKFLF